MKRQIWISCLELNRKWKMRSGVECLTKNLKRLSHFQITIEQLWNRRVSLHVMFTASFRHLLTVIKCLWVRSQQVGAAYFPLVKMIDNLPSWALLINNPHWCNDPDCCCCRELNSAFSGSDFFSFFSFLLFLCLLYDIWD